MCNLAHRSQSSEGTMSLGSLTGYHVPEHTTPQQHDCESLCSVMLYDTFPVRRLLCKNMDQANTVTQDIPKSFPADLNLDMKYTCDKGRAPYHNVYFNTAS